MENNWQDILQSLKAGGSLPEGEEPAPAADVKAAAKCKLTIAIEKKGRGGKTATIISGFTESHDEIAALAARLKSRLGTGGSARGGEILIQGNRAADVRKALEVLGFKSRII